MRQFLVFTFGFLLAIAAAGQTTVVTVNTTPPAAGGCSLTVANTSLIDFWDFEDSANMGDSSAGQSTTLNEFNMSGTQTATGALTGSSAFDVANTSEIRSNTYSGDSGFNANTDSTDWSICGNVYIETSPAGSLDHIFATRLRGETYIDSGDDDLKMQWGGSTGTVNRENVVVGFSATDEHFICVTVDGVAAAVDNVNYYVDGAVSSGSPFTTQEMLEANTFTIGADHNGNGNGDSFILDSVSTFNKELSAAEVAELGGACGGKVSDA